MAARRKPMERIYPSALSLNLDGFQDAAKVAIEKDIPLLEAAIAADRVIVTRDNRLQKALAETPDGVALAARIKWINPVTDDLDILKSL